MPARRCHPPPATVAGPALHRAKGDMISLRYSKQSAANLGGTISQSGPTLPTWALLQVGGYSFT